METEKTEVTNNNVNEELRAKAGGWKDDYIAQRA